MDTNAERYRKIGLRIAYYRKLNKLTQENLAELIDRSASHISHVESPSMAQPISLEMLFAIADALKVPPAKFLEDL